MSFIQTSGLEDIHEQQPVDEGNYQLVVANISEDPSKAGKPMLTIIHELEEHPDAMSVYFYLPLPADDDEPKSRNFKMLQMKRYLALVGIEYDPAEGFDSDDLYGMSFSAYLSKEEVEKEDADPNDPPSFRNSIKVPKLQD